ncbi:MAG: methylated-DNA--[protein]-cysteine S-methyltransferase [Eggerthellaceae bacterium]
MSESTFFTYNTPVGRVTIASNGCAITAIAIGEVGLPGVRKPTLLTNDAANQLQEYLAGRRRYFDLPLDPAGSPFQKKVWREMLDIPYGSTKTYGEIACAVGSPRGARAVGMAANRNPIAIVIPCHRVLASNGKPGGYAYGVEVKRFLLDLERRSN